MITDAKVIQAYITLRNMKSETAARHKEELAPIVDKMNKLEAWMLRKLQKEEAESSKTGQGTAFLTTKTYVNIKNWEAFVAFAKENDLLHMVAKNVSKDAIKEYLDANGELPPGIEITSEIVCQFRSPK